MLGTPSARVGEWRGQLAGECGVVLGREGVGVRGRNRPRCSVGVVSE